MSKKDDDKFDFDDDFPEEFQDEFDDTGLGDDLDDLDDAAGLEQEFGSGDDTADGPEPEEQTSEHSESKPKAASAMSQPIDWLKENWLYAVLGVVGGIVAIYMIWGIIYPTAPQRPPQHQQQGRDFGLSAQNQQQQQTEKPKEVKQAKKPDSVQLPDNSYIMKQKDFENLMQGFQKTVNDDASQLDDALSKKIDKLSAAQNQINKNANADIQKLAQQVKHVTGNISQLEQQIRTVNSALAQQQKTTETIAKSLQTTQKDLQMLNAQKAASMQKLVLRAVVPGRAWLVDGADNTISVTEGDKLPFYGTVESIDADQGTVTMSSGYEFK